jgi:hypothetical protein
MLLLNSIKSWFFKAEIRCVFCVRRNLIFSTYTIKRRFVFLTMTSEDGKSYFVSDNTPL